ncbi:MAG: hypothetical protein LBM20_07455 [Rikenellaceae bacterium]|nr:hypothetical protein [Rikenellaceae bacterium]
MYIYIGVQHIDNQKATQNRVEETNDAEKRQKMVIDTFASPGFVSPKQQQQNAERDKYCGIRDE